MRSRAAVDQSLELKYFNWQWVIFRGINANLMFHRRCPTIRSVRGGESAGVECL